MPAQKGGDGKTPICRGCIVINMHVYLPEKYRSPLLHGAFLFSRVGVSDSKLWCHFSLLLTRVTSCDLDPRAGYDINIHLIPQTFIWRDFQLNPTFPIFLEGESWSQPYVFWWIALQLDHARKCLNKVWGWGYVKEDLVIYKELFSCRIFGISKLFQTQKSFWHWFKANSFWGNSSDSYGEVFRCDENFLFWFWWKIWSDIWLVTKGWNFNLRVNENRFSKHSFYLHE